MGYPTGTDWNFDNLEGLIQRRGDEVIHEKGVACPCRAEDAYASTILRENKPATQRKFGCEQCGGDGWIYRDARIIKGLITGVEAGRNRQLLEMGYAVPGDSVFSPSLEAGQISDFDRVTLLYPVPVGDGQVVMRGAAQLEENKTLDLGLADNEDRLWYEPDCIEWCEDENGVVYSQDADFTVDGKKIIWTSSGPAPGTYYTVKYNAYLQWIIYATPMTRFDKSRTLGQKALLRKVHVAQINDYKFETASDREAQELTFTTKTTI